MPTIYNIIGLVKLKKITRICRRLAVDLLDDRLNRKSPANLQIVVSPENLQQV
jgi:hypothetical protein